MSTRVMYSLEEAAARIASGAPLLIAGDEQLLDQLPRGRWIGGTIPYFIGDEGGCRTDKQVFVTELQGIEGQPDVRFYDGVNLSHIATDAPENGLSLIVIPFGSDAHRLYAERAPSFPEMFLKPIVGWIAGVGLDQLGTVSPRVFNGLTGEKDGERAIVMHLTLPAHVMASVGIVNVFEGGDGDVISFPSDGFEIGDCFVNGEAQSFAQYLVEREIDTRLPLVANYAGAMVNSSVQSVDAEAGRVTCYAPVFKDVEYRVAKPVSDYAAAFARAIPDGLDNTAFTCNCILNYLYGELEGKRTGQMKGPITFGEIAYQLLNQTMVYVTLEAA